MQWEVEYTDQFEAWWQSLALSQQAAVGAAVDELVEVGPGLGRPHVDVIKGSRHHNMKELRPQAAGRLRVLFIFDPRRHAILLIGGDKSGRWQAWYDEFIPIADRLYDEYLQELHNEGAL